MRSLQVLEDFMQLSFAPMEGITYAAYRLVHSSLFTGADKYYSPFIAPDSTGRFKLSHLRGLLPESNTGLKLIPQVLANDPEAFVKVAHQVAELGYDEVNLNAGCPSGTVVSKHKGSGMLEDLSSLARFLDCVFEKSPVKVSVKTRMGINSTDEFPALCKLYSNYPICELTVHARDRKGMYKSTPDPDMLVGCLGLLNMPVTYNGNIFKPSDIQLIKEKLPTVDSFMLGRGAAANPALFREIKGGAPLTREEMKTFHDTMLEKVIADGLSPNFAVMRMKELWFYMISMYPNSEKAFKALNKATRFEDFKSAASFILTSCEFDSSSGFNRQ